MVSLGNNRTLSFSNDDDDDEPGCGSGLDHEHEEEVDIINHTNTTGGTGNSDTSQLLSGTNHHHHSIHPNPTTGTRGSGGGPVPGGPNDYNFRTIETTSIGIFQIFCSIGLFILSAFMPIECGAGAPGTAPAEPCHFNSFSLILYAHGLFWGLCLISDQYIQYQHLKARRRGYLEFYSETRFISQLPIWIVSAWSTLLLTISTILHDHCESNYKCGTLVQLSKSDYVSICIGIEVLVLVPVVGIYVSKVWKFNSSKSLPDVLKDDDAMNRNFCTLDFGPNCLAPLDEELFQRQAELIQYYKATNNMLRRTVLELKNGITTTRASTNMERPTNNF